LPPRIVKKVNIKVRFTYIASQASYTASTALCVTDKAGIQPRPQLKPALRTLACSHIAVRSPTLRFNGPKVMKVHETILAYMVLRENVTYDRPKNTQGK